MPVRKPAVAGSFYPADARELEALIRESSLHRLGPGKLPPADYSSKGIVACVAPHAGYIYSGPVAAHSYLHVSSLRKPQLIVIVAPNHYGVGSGVATFKGGVWETPLGGVSVDEAAAEEIVRRTGIVDYDADAHRMEHSLEVQLPFLQQIYGDSIRMLPISLAFQDAPTAKTVGVGIAELVKGREAVLVASSDLTHYEPSGEARSKDLRLIKEMEEMDVEGFYSALERYRVTACGYGAIAAVMHACALLGLKKGELLKYANSGDSTGDISSVVGYASLRFV
jgi:AmmeMemoRadiSam system protein B